MGSLILAVITLFFYSVGTALQALKFRKRINTTPSFDLMIGGLALAGHGALLWTHSHLDGAFNFSLSHISVLISWLLVAMLLLMNLRKPIQSLFLAIYPLAALTVVFLLIFHGPPKLVAEGNWGLLSHVALSVTAYSLFTLAAVQALLLFAQNRQLKHKHSGLLVRNLPPLQTMESILFEMVWAGVILLVLAILTGAIFVKDLFAQDLAHKTLFSLVSLTVFVTLLIGRHAWGWRGEKAARWTLTGCLLLMIGFYGSKFALELVFHRVG